jgi:hypothetical protein
MSFTKLLTISFVWISRISAIAIRATASPFRMSNWPPPPINIQISPEVMRVVESVSGASSETAEYWWKAAIRLALRARWERLR